MSDQQPQTNETVQSWNAQGLAQHYASREQSLWPDEWHALGASWAHIAGQPVLDIGIGAGRTTAYLKPVAGSYVGIDISAAMLQQAKQRFPDADLRLGDVRKLDFPDQSFSFVMFSFNGIDYIKPEERITALREIRRVLRPGGCFVFSSHNRHVQGDRPPPFDPPVAWPTSNPLKRIVRAIQTAGARRRGLANFRRLESQQWVRPEIAWINDSAYEAAFLSCHITPAEQIRQLQAAGFGNVDLILDTQGRRCGVDMRDRFFYVRALA
jgi:ubiquinone/menaquinone biosynthesis C-methylase UbiE